MNTIGAILAIITIPFIIIGAVARLVWAGLEVGWAGMDELMTWSMK